MSEKTSEGTQSSSPPSLGAERAESQVNSEDDWSGLTDPAERRRRQNRLNQRAYRRRKRLQRNSSYYSAGQSQTGTAISPLTPFWHLKAEEVEINCSAAPALAKQMLESFSRSAYQSYILGCPTADHLLTLTKVNVYRAFCSNLAVLGLSHESMHDDALSPFNTMMPGFEDKAKSLPPSLRPTPVQRSLHHHPWLDFFPLPQMRDNLIRAQDRFDEEQLCVDVLGFWNPSAEDPALIVWGEPSDPRNWEVTESFIKKWGWAIRGCPELLQSTNHWRAKRGEKLIFRYL